MNLNRSKSTQYYQLISRISDHWFKFSTIEIIAYQTFDMDKYLILIFSSKSFRHYADIFIIHSENNFIPKKNLKSKKLILLRSQKIYQLQKKQ